MAKKKESEKAEAQKGPSKKLTFPYMMHCPKCATKLKIKSPEMVGKSIHCPKCKKRIDVVTPEEDAHVAYGVEVHEAHKEEEEPELTEEELEELEEKKLAEKRAQQWAKTKEILGILWLVLLLVALGWVVYEFVIKDSPEDEAGRATGWLEWREVDHMERRTFLARRGSRSTVHASRTSVGRAAWHDRHIRQAQQLLDEDQLARVVPLDGMADEL